MKITTESGAVYDITDGFCVKTGHDGEVHSPFKVWVLKPFPEDTPDWDALQALPTGEPVIGQRMYIAGKDEWCISTKVVSVDA